MIREHITQLKSEPKTFPDTSPEKNFKWQVSV